MKTDVVQVSIKGYTTEFVGKAALIIKGLILLVLAYAFYKLLTQRILTITVV